MSVCVSARRKYGGMNTFAQVLGLSELNRNNNQQTMEASRKRRLDHLSLEEKINRKKLKNRVAAQTSRDRKKARMDELEDEIKTLNRKTHLLASDNCRLKAENEKLCAENEKLRRPHSVRCWPLNSRPAAGERAAAGTVADDDYDFLDSALRDLPDLPDFDGECGLEELAASLLQEASRDCHLLGAPGDAGSGPQEVVGSTSECVEPRRDLGNAWASDLDDQYSMDITHVPNEEVAEEVEVMTSDEVLSPMPSEHWSDAGYESVDSPRSIRSEHPDLWTELFPSLM